jgi:anti-sigma B factor antagonist
MITSFKAAKKIGKNDCCVVTLTGELDVASSSRLRRFVQDLPASRKRYVVVDLALLSFCDAAGIGTLVHVYGELTNRAAGVVFIYPKKKSVRMLFEITGVTNHVPFYTTIDAAIRANVPHSPPRRKTREAEGRGQRK